MGASSCINISSPHRTLRVSRTTNGVALDVAITLLDLVPRGETGDRPVSPREGELFYSYTTKSYDFWNGSIWTPLGGTAVPLSKFYFGSKSTATIPTAEQITAASSIGYQKGENFTVPFEGAALQYYWVAWDASDTGIDNYYINQFDHGTMGPDGTLATPIQISNLFYTQVNYPTSIESITLKH